MSIATGRDPQAYELLQNPPSSVEIAIPSICCLEALSALNLSEKSRKRFEQELNVQANEVKRNLSSSHAQALSFHLDRSRAQNRMLITETKNRLFDALNQIATKAELIDLNARMLQDSLSQILISERTDNLILHCLMGHAVSHQTEIKVFLSGNVNDFGTSAVREALQNVGVNEYFRRTQDFLGWIQSQEMT